MFSPPNCLEMNVSGHVCLMHATKAATDN